MSSSILSLSTKIYNKRQFKCFAAESRNDTPRSISAAVSPHISKYSIYISLSINTYIIIIHSCQFIIIYRVYAVYTIFLHVHLICRLALLTHLRLTWLIYCLHDYAYILFLYQFFSLLVFTFLRNNFPLRRRNRRTHNKCSITHSLAHSTHSLTHSLTYLLTYLFTLSLYYLYLFICLPVCLTWIDHDRMRNTIKSRF